MRSLEISINEARAITGLKLVSAAEAVTSAGMTYQPLNAKSVGAAHRDARDACINWFYARGYNVFPHGVGVEGLFTLADFLAVRSDERRIVFVEVIRAARVTAEMIARKHALQGRAELCFVFYDAKNGFDGPATELLHRPAAELDADLLRYVSDDQNGDYLANSTRASVAFHTTQQQGVRVEAAVAEGRGSTVIVIQYLTRPYKRSVDESILDLFASERHFFEFKFLWAFQQFCRRRDAVVKSTRARPDLTNYNAMRRKAGLKAFTRNGDLFGVLRTKPGPSASLDDASLQHESTAIAAGGPLSGVYEFPNAHGDPTVTLFDVFREMGCRVDLRP